MNLRELFKEALQDLERIGSAKSSTAITSTTGSTHLLNKLRILSKLQSVLGSRKRSVAVAEAPKLELVSGNEVLSYNVGCWRVSIVETKPMEFTYIVRPLINEDFFKLVEGRLDDIIALMRRGNDIADVLVATLKIPRDQVPEALFALRSIVGYRQLEVFLQDPYVTDIAVNGAGAVWVKHGYLERYPNIDFIPSNIYFKTMENVIELQQIIATKCGTYISVSNPIVDTQLPPRDGGHRVHLVHYIISTVRRPEIVIRKRMSVPPSIAQMAEQGVLPESVAKLLKVVIYSRGSLIIAGPPGSGKTTLLRSILYSFVPLGWKVAIIEDTGEIDPLPSSSWTRYTTFELGNVKVDLFDLAKAALRASATKLIVVGEVRGAEAKVLVQAMLTGLGGLCTWHGGSAQEVMVRFSSPPIELSASQIGMFNFVALMGYGEKPKRQLKQVVEFIYDHDHDRVLTNVVWDRQQDGMDISFDELVKRVKRWNELRLKAEVPVEKLIASL
jgi:flagellar protein FlaI